MQEGGHAVLINISVAVPEGADAGEIARDALAHENARPLREGKFSPEFALTGGGIRWPRFFDRNRHNDLVVQVDNAQGQNFQGVADAVANAAGHTWANVQTATFADAVGGASSNPVIGRAV
jgi:hypothetical protein